MTDLRRWLFQPILTALHALNERLDMDQAQELTALAAIDDGLTQVNASLGEVQVTMQRGLDEVVADIANLKANMPPGTNTQVDALFLSISNKMAALKGNAASLGAVASALDNVADPIASLAETRVEGA